MQKILVTLILFFITWLPLYAEEVYGELGTTNLIFTDTGNLQNGEDFDGKDFAAVYNFYYDKDIQDGVNLKVGVLGDSIIRKRVYSDIGFSAGNFLIDFVPFLAAFNTQPKWFNPGISADLKYSLPGFGFFKGGFLTSFAPLSQKGDTYMASLSAGLGITLENGIITFGVEDKSFTNRRSDDDVMDEQIKYTLDTEVFVKNIPVRFAVLLGYQILKRTYTYTADEYKTDLHTALFGERVTWDISPKISWFIENESSVLTLGFEKTQYNVSDYTYLFNFKTGLRYQF